MLHFISLHIISFYDFFDKHLYKNADICRVSINQKTLSNLYLTEILY